MGDTHYCITVLFRYADSLTLYGALALNEVGAGAPLTVFADSIREAGDISPEWNAPDSLLDLVRVVVHGQEPKALSLDELVVSLKRPIALTSPLVERCETLEGRAKFLSGRAHELIPLSRKPLVVMYLQAERVYEARIGRGPAGSNWEIHLHPPPPGYVPAGVSASRAKQTLLEATDAIVEFAERQGILSEASGFVAARGLLQGPAPTPRVHFLKSWSAEQQRLLDAASRADVFAGKGGWNDAPIQKDDEFRSLSNQVCLGIAECLCACVNAEETDT